LGRRLGELCDLDYANISRMESGNKKILVPTLKNIANILEMEVKDLL
jgi:DNA-binding Xre family transcriptional regulator